jgi:putative transposase
VEKDNGEITVTRQCELLNLPRSSYYYSTTGNDDFNFELMGLINEQYTSAPFYGIRRVTAWFRAHGHEVNVKRVRKLFRRLGLQAI